MLGRPLLQFLLLEIFLVVLGQFIHATDGDPCQFDFALLRNPGVNRALSNILEAGTGRLNHLVVRAIRDPHVFFTEQYRDVENQFRQLV